MEIKFKKKIEAEQDWVINTDDVRQINETFANLLESKLTHNPRSTMITDDIWTLFGSYNDDERFNILLQLKKLGFEFKYVSAYVVSIWWR